MKSLVGVCDCACIVVCRGKVKHELHCAFFVASPSFEFKS